MELKKGIGVSTGVVIGPALLLDNDEIRIGRRAITLAEVAAEQQRLRTALTAASDDLRDLRERTRRNLGKEMAAIFDFHLALLNDPQLQAAFSQGIERDSHSAEFAVRRALREYGKHFTEHPDAYFRERVKDIYDLERRLLQHLMGAGKIRLEPTDQPVVIVAHDLTPSQTASLDKSKVRGIAIEAGGRTSHTAILANSLGIPAVVGLDSLTREVTTGDVLVVNGYSGVVIIDPDAATIEEHQKYEQRQVRYRTQLDSMRHLPARTKDGVDIKLFGNIEFPHEVDTALAKGAMGIGLYRTEFLYLAGGHEPTEEDHYAAYCRVLQCMGQRPVVIRTLDLGADKYSPFQDQVPEANPFLGFRSIRLCLGNLRIFKTQLRAILRASTRGDLRLMFPLISTPLELRQAKMVLKDTMEELDEQNIPYNPHLRVGMMVEVPSTALLPKPYVRDCDFLSIGTNDLIQYTLAVDRGNQRVASLYSAANPAVLRLIKNVIWSARSRRRAISLCGEMGGDPDFTLLLVGLGLRQFSVAPQHIPEIKKVIRSMNARHARQVAQRALGFEHTQQVMGFLREETRKILPDIFSEVPAKPVTATV